MYDNRCFRGQDGSRNCILRNHPRDEHCPSPPCLNCKELVVWCRCGNRVPANPRQNREFWGEELESDDEFLPSLDDYYESVTPVDSQAPNPDDIVMNHDEIDMDTDE